MAKAKKQKVSAKERKDEVVQKLIDALSEGKLPYQYAWNSLGGPHNPLTGTRYKGENAFHLGLQMMIRGIKDPRFTTYNAAKKAGWQVKKGASSIPIFFMSKMIKLDKKVAGKTWWPERDLKRILAEKGMSWPADAKPVFTTRFSLVFSYEDIDGAPSLEEIVGDGPTGEEIIEPEWLSALTQEVPLNRGGDQAYYSPMTDEVTLPSRELFKTLAGEASVLFHEYAHASAKRLDRDLSDYHASKDARGREELVAESAAAMVMAMIGQDYDPVHAAYIQSWAKALQAKDPAERIKEASKAFKDGEKAADWVLSFRETAEQKSSKAA